MRNLIALALAGTALVSGPALAADFVFAPPPMIAPAPMPMGFPWAGGYIGTFVEYGTLIPSFGYGVQAGYNFVRGNLLLGAEVETSHFSGVGTTIDASFVGRAGVIRNDRILIYGQAGIGLLVGTPIFSIGGGVELALRQSLSAFVEAKASFVLGGGFAAPMGTEIRVGLNYHGGDVAMGGIGGGIGSPWSGLYIGTIAGFSTLAPVAEMGVQVGYNFNPGNLVAGFEVQTSYTTGALINASLGGRVGFGVGERTLVYGKGAIGSAFAVPFWSIGGGVEVAMGTQASVFAGVDRLSAIGGGPFALRFAGGVNLHLGQ